MLLLLYVCVVFGWENWLIGEYLEVMIDWVEVFEEGLCFYDVFDNLWWCIVDILFVGKIYE